MGVKRELRSQDGLRKTGPLSAVSSVRHVLAVNSTPSAEHLAAQPHALSWSPISVELHLTPEERLDLLVCNGRRRTIAGYHRNHGARSGGS